MHVDRDHRPSAALLFLRRSALAAILSLCLAATAIAQESEKPEKIKLDPAEWAPADTIAFLGITDVDQTWKDLKKTSLYAMANDSSLKGKLPQIAALGLAPRKFQEKLAKVLGVEAEQLKNPFKGPLALYLNAPKGAGPDQVEAGLVAAVGDPEAMKKYYQAAVAKLKETADKYDSESVGSNNIDIFTTAKKEAGAKEADEEDEEDLSPGALLGEEGVSKLMEKQLDKMFSKERLPEKLASCLTEDRLIVGASVDQVKAMLRREKNSTLADSDDYKALLRHLKPVGSIRFLVNLPRVFELAKADKTVDSGEFASTMKVLGAEGLRSLVGHIRIGAQSYELKSDALFLMKGDRSGLAKILSMENRSVAPPAGVPSDAGFFVSANLNPGKLIDEIESMIRQNSPESADSMHQFFAHVPLPGGETVDLRKELIDYLKEPLTFYLSIAKPVKPESIRMLLTIGNKDREAINRFFGKIPMLAAHEQRGTQIFVPTMGGGAAEFGLAATNDRVLIGNTNAIEPALAGGDSAGLAESSIWKRAARYLPPEAWLVLFRDNHRMLENILEIKRNKEAFEAAGQSPTTGFLYFLASAAGNMDEDAIQALMKYTGQDVMSIATISEGVQFTIISLKPDEK